MAIDNLEWDPNKIVTGMGRDNIHGGETDDPNIHIQNARQMWARKPVFTDRADALKEADRMLQEVEICEYGISFVNINRKF